MDVNRCEIVVFKIRKKTGDEQKSKGCRCWLFWFTWAYLGLWRWFGALGLAWIIEAISTKENTPIEHDACSSCRFTSRGQSQCIRS